MASINEQVIDVYRRLHTQRSALVARYNDLIQQSHEHFIAGEYEAEDIACDEADVADQAVEAWDEAHSEEYHRLARYLRSQGIDPEEVVKEHIPEQAEAGT